MKITLLGTGTPAPSLMRQSSGYAIEVGDDVIVMDHGPGAHHRLLESGLKAVDVTHALFSHLHYDHCLEYPRLVLQHWDQGGGQVPELRVFGPRPTARMTEQLFGSDGVFAPDLRARTENESSLLVFAERGGTPPRNWPAPAVREIHAGDTISGDSWQITVGHARHVQPELECLAFRLDCEAGSFCYSGDSGGVLEEMIELARGCDVLIHMNHSQTGTEGTAKDRLAVGNHLDNAAIASRAQVKALVLTHIPPQIDQPELRDQMTREMAAEYDGPIIWGEDLMRIFIDRPHDLRVENPA